MSTLRRAILPLLLSTVLIACFGDRDGDDGGEEPADEAPGIEGEVEADEPGSDDGTDEAVAEGEDSDEASAAPPKTAELVATDCSWRQPFSCDAECTVDDDAEPSATFSTGLSRLDEIGFQAHSRDSDPRLAYQRRSPEEDPGYDALPRIDFVYEGAEETAQDSPWFDGEKFYGACRGLQAVFFSYVHSVEGEADLFEFRFTSKDRAEELAANADDFHWAKHPVEALAVGESTIVVRGRHRTPVVMDQLAEHFQQLSDDERVD